MIMGKENENINIFIIEDDYRRSKAKQNAHDDLSRKPEPIILNKQNHESVIQELEKMHSNFEAGQEPESLQETEVTKQINPSQIADSPSSINDLELLASLQEMKTEEQELLKQKQRLLSREQDLRNRLVKELDRKKTTINNLKTEIPAITNRCKGLSQVLGE